MPANLTAKEAAGTGAFRLHWHESFEDVDAAVLALASMTPQARKLLSEVIQEQGVTRSKLSAGGEVLESAGFVRVRDLDGVFSTAVEILPTLWGEEAMEALEAGVGKPLKR